MFSKEERKKIATLSVDELINCITTANDERVRHAIIEEWLLPQEEMDKNHRRVRVLATFQLIVIGIAVGVLLSVLL